MADIYLDSASATPLLPSAREAMIEALDIFGDPLNIHVDGRGARRLLDDARDAIAGAIGAGRCDASQAKTTAASVSGTSAGRTASRRIDWDGRLPQSC